MAVDISAIGQAAGTVLNGLGRAMNSSTSDTNLIPHFDSRGRKYARNANWVQGVGHLANLGTTIGSSWANAKKIAKQERENPGSTQLQQNKYGITFSDTDGNLNQYQNRRSAYKAIDDEYNDILEQERISHELDPEYYEEYFGTPEQEAESWRQTSRDNAQRFYTPEGYLFRRGIERNFPNSNYNRNTMPYVNIYAPGGDIKTQQKNGMPWGNIMDTANQAFDSFAGNVYAPKSMQEAAVRGDSTEDPLSELLISNKRTKQGLNWVRSNNDNTGVNMYTESGLANDIQKYNQLDKVDRLGFGRALTGNLQASAKGAAWGTKIGGAGLGTLIGGIAGGVANIGSLFQKHRARKKMNEAIEKQNNINQSTILHNVNKVGNTLYNNQMANYKAYGGNLFANGGTINSTTDNKYDDGGFIDSYVNPSSTAGVVAKGALQLLDPTGISSYPDVYYSGRDFFNDPSWENAGNFGLNLLGALPLIGKITTPFKAAKMAKLLSRAGDATALVKTADRVEDVNKAIDTIQELIPITRNAAKKTQDFTTSLIIDPLYQGVIHNRNMIRGRMDNVDAIRLYKTGNAIIDYINAANNAADFSGIAREMYNANKKSEGGPLFNKSSNGVTQFNEGGTHEENPYGGIPQGINKENGLPNKVEEGEVKYNDFIYSNRLTIPKGAAEEAGLPKSIEGKTFAEAANILQKESSNRPNDKISKQELDIVLGKLKDLQIKVKEQQDQEELAQQNDPMAEHQLDPMQDPAMQDPMAQMDPSMMDPSMMGMDPTAMGMDPSMMQDPNAMMPPMDPSMMGGAGGQPPMDPAMIGMMAYGGRLYNSYGANDKDLNTIQANSSTAQRQNQLELYTEEEMNDPNFVRLSKNPGFKGAISYTYGDGYRDNDEFINSFIWNKQNKDYTSPYLGFVNSIKPTENNISLLRKLFVDQYSGKPLNYTVRKDGSKHVAKTDDEIGKVFDNIISGARNADGTIDNAKFRSTVLPYMLDTNFAGFHNRIIKDFLSRRNPSVVPPIITPQNETTPPNNPSNTLRGFNPEVGKLRIPEFNNSLRYAPVYGAMEAIANAKENPSYFRANMQEQLPRIEPVYENVYLPYEAADLNYHVNQLRSQEAQALQALSNAGAGPGAIMATAQKYNDAIGQAKAQAADLNWARRREVAARDAQREQFNAQQIANTRAHNSNLDNIEFQNRIKQRENMYDDYKWNRQDRDQSKTALYNSLYNIGTENMHRDERAWMIENGLLGSRMYNPFKKLYPVARDLSYLQRQMTETDARDQEIADREAEIEANLSYLESMIPKEIEDAEAIAEYEALRKAWEEQKNKNNSNSNAVPNHYYKPKLAPKLNITDTPLSPEDLKYLDEVDLMDPYYKPKLAPQLNVKDTPLSPEDLKYLESVDLADSLYKPKLAPKLNITDEPLSKDNLKYLDEVELKDSYIMPNMNAGINPDVLRMEMAESDARLEEEKNRFFDYDYARSNEQLSKSAVTLPKMAPEIIIKDKPLSKKDLEYLNEVDLIDSYYKPKLAPKLNITDEPLSKKDLKYLDKVELKDSYTMPNMNAGINPDVLRMEMAESDARLEEEKNRFLDKDYSTLKDMFYDQKLKDISREINGKTSFVYSDEDKKFLRENGLDPDTVTVKEAQDIVYKEQMGIIAKAINQLEDAVKQSVKDKIEGNAMLYKHWKTAKYILEDYSDDPEKGIDEMIDLIELSMNFKYGIFKYLLKDLYEELKEKKEDRKRKKIMHLVSPKQRGYLNKAFIDFTSSTRSNPF